MRHYIIAAVAVALTASTLAHAESPLIKSLDQYAKACRKYNAVTGRSVQEIQTNMTEYAGRHVEIRGRVLGRVRPVSSGDEGMSLLLKCDEDNCYISCPPDLTELRPERRVRMLVHLPKDAADMSDGMLKAVADDPAPEAPATTQTGSRDGERRLEIGEAARGVRDRVPWQRTNGTLVPPTIPNGGLPSVPNAPPPSGQWSGGSGLPPELRGKPTLSDPTGGSSGASTTAPAVTFSGRQHTYEQVVAIWKQWVRKQNSKIPDIEVDHIVRWNIYHCAKNGVDHRLMFSVMKYESDFNRRCKSSAGAMGLTQLMPFNCTDFKVADPYSVGENIRGGVEHLGEFLRKYQGRPYYEQTVLSLACYNAGPGNVKKYGGVPPFRETQSYVKKVPALFAELVKQGYP